jgi:hypothetical protein
VASGIEALCACAAKLPSKTTRVKRMTLLIRLSSSNPGSRGGYPEYADDYIQAAETEPSNWVINFIRESLQSKMMRWLP